PSSGDGFGECGALREKSIARVHAVGPRLYGGLEQPVDAEVALGGWRWADMHGGICRANVRAQPVGGRVDRYGFESFFVAGTDDPERDLAPVGDQDTAHSAAVTGRRREEALRAVGEG